MLDNHNILCYIILVIDFCARPKWATVAYFLLHRIHTLSFKTSADRIILPFLGRGNVGTFYIDIKALGQKGEKQRICYLKITPVNPENRRNYV